MTCQDYRHPLVHNGANQKGRLAAALLPESARLDSRTVADMAHFTHQLARLLKYFNLDNREEGNWQCFFEKEEASILAIIAAIDLEHYDEAYCEAEVRFWKDDSRFGENPEQQRAKRTENYQILIDNIYRLALRLQQLCQGIPDGLAMKQEIVDIIRDQVATAIFDNRIQNALEQLIAYDKGSEPPATRQKYNAFIAEQGNASDCTRVWGLPGEDAYYCILADDGYKEEQPPDGCKENRNLRALFIIFFQALTMIVARAKVHLRRVLIQNRGHEPHLSLFLAFIFIFKYLQRQYNQIPQRHLDFYYAEVLGLEPLTYKADQAHVIFELAQNFEDFVLKPGTLLESIKDSNGNPIRYFLNNELIANQAKVEALKTSFLNDEPDGYQLFAAPSADSADGSGAPFESPAETRWRPLGDVKEGSFPGQVGFAIASPEFTLREGERFIRLSLKFKNATPDAAIDALKDAVRHLEISTNEGDAAWFEIGQNTALSGKNFDSEFLNEETGFHLHRVNKDLQCDILLTPAAPGFDLPKNSPRAFFKHAKYPALKFLLKKQANLANGYAALRPLQIKDIDIEVGVRGARTLILQNETGIYDNTQPFTAFGKMTNTAGPHAANPLYIGSDEVLRKNVQGRFDILFQSLRVPSITSIGLTGPTASFLVDRNFVSVTNLNLTTGNSITPKEIPFLDIVNAASDPLLMKISIGGNTTLPLKRVAHNNLEPINFKTASGFIKLLLNYALTPSGGTPRDFFPQFQNFFINYRARRDSDFEQKEQFFHILPFGFNELKNTTADNNPVSIIPPFAPPLSARSGKADSSLLAGGNLYIGVKGLLPGQSLSLLFQVLPGSGDARFEPPDIQWSFVKADEVSGTGFAWQEFSPEDIVRDTTKVDQGTAKSLLQSGIVQFNTPTETSSAGTLADPDAGLFWIRASAVENHGKRERAAALPDLAAVHAQAVLCTFINNGNSLEHLESAMPQQSITKLTERKTAIRKVEQPYASFGAKPVELPEAFYRRVSERLRHKNRAVCLWDYERLLLEAFPEIRHAKCITHTSAACEIDPGYVMVAVFPDLHNRNGVDRITPGLGGGELEAMEQFLRGRANLFLYCEGGIEVVNPLYELLRAECCIRFRKGFLPLKYAGILDEDIKRFLAPWAFDVEAEIFFSGEFHTSTILNFIEERPYVDKVAEFRVYHYIKDPLSGVPVSQYFDDQGKEAPLPEGRELILSASARSIFTSFSTEGDKELGHIIKIWGEEGCDKCKAEEFTRFDLCSDSESTPSL